MERFAPCTFQEAGLSGKFLLVKEDGTKIARNATHHTINSCILTTESPTPAFQLPLNEQKAGNPGRETILQRTATLEHFCTPKPQGGQGPSEVSSCQVVLSPFPAHGGVPPSRPWICCNDKSSRHLIHPQQKANTSPDQNQVTS